jgi:phosphopentomutase
MHDGLIFANLADFDALYGHPRNLHGFADALAEFDAWLGSFIPHIDSEDLVILTADHGNDPTFRGNGHTREEVPLIAICDGITGPLGVSETFADVAATLAAFFGLEDPWPVGKNFLHISGKRPRIFHLHR